MHDASYKLLFSHAAMVEDLLRGFVPQSWVQALDFATLEKVNASYVAEDLRDRHDDVVWRVRFQDHWLYVYLLLEFLCGAPHKNSYVESMIMRSSLVKTAN
jgi:predicted transposase YdaD